MRRQTNLFFSKKNSSKSTEVVSNFFFYDSKQKDLRKKKKKIIDMQTKFSPLRKQKKPFNPRKLPQISTLSLNIIFCNISQLKGNFRKRANLPLFVFAVIFLLERDIEKKIFIADRVNRNVLWACLQKACTRPIIKGWINFNYSGASVLSVRLN